MSYRIERATIDGQIIENVVRIADNACIPPDPANVDYTAFQAWRVAGGVPDLVEKFVAQSPARDLKAELELERARIDAILASIAGTNG